MYFLTGLIRPGLPCPLLSSVWASQSNLSTNWNLISMPAWIAALAKTALKSAQSFQDTFLECNTIFIDLP